MSVINVNRITRKRKSLVRDVGANPDLQLKTYTQMEMIIQKKKEEQLTRDIKTVKWLCIATALIVLADLL